MNNRGLFYKLYMQNFLLNFVQNLLMDDLTTSKALRH